MIPCPCGSDKPFTACCQPYLSGTSRPQSPEQLMRSRYTAFCQSNIDYLIATHHPSQRRGDDRRTLAKTIAETTWLGLRVLNSDDRQIADGTGTVEFVAFYQGNDGPAQLHEKSEFIRQNERWYYMGGEMLDPIRLGRNDPCWCGSGKKLKQCHSG